MVGEESVEIALFGVIARMRHDIDVHFVLVCSPAMRTASSTTRAASSSSTGVYRPFFVRL